MIRRRLAAFLRVLADRIAPPEREPEIVSYAEFCRRLKDERDRELSGEPPRSYLLLTLRRVK